ncbi:glycoside hydrolase family 38 N-terminal domain-containing protein [Latilactobacillus fuchuensis]|uniref:Glycosyl hydrolase family 38 N-terminal domain protein n=2 Tax=Latilactobacillus fuchuensis TaxID=164393 RepID=A0A2N9DXZ3_9LACO|nr:glycoside hydrolase family 38 C-terminal domain-containing protein [Latilactobacillus fuchuensis]KRL58592.1 alpha-mannosidase [Latilactobacillus fuchuensis DSM 14340 = JCM 11249]MCP8857399.1 alpha-mannosidase [Latilactobacillus fuchuensis]SPC39691.1 Glycosyl hydrolase family 38 N-terminal domain protein [Latilactobacillus fuchuensis]
MTKIHAIAHTHWDFEWYFTRQEARVQFAFHMDDVFAALTDNQLDYYLLDGQLSIIDDYLTAFPEKESVLRQFVTAGRLFIGPWYTQIDEMVTSGESIVRNLKLGMRLGDALGGVMKVGYLPDSFGQGQDMPKIYNGVGINSTVFWRGFPSDNDARYFYWDSNDGSQVIAANIKNGYYAGVDLIEKDDVPALLTRIATHTTATNQVLPVGGDQRAIDFNLKTRLNQANDAIDTNDSIIESNYPAFFDALAQETNLPAFSGEFIDPSDSKIHRGIYSSRYDLKQLYDQLEREMTYQIEPLMALAAHQGIESKQGLIDEIWQTIARGQAHDSSGGCNSDKTNQDIYQRGVTAHQLAYSLKDYLLRKLSISINNDQPIDLFAWNPLPMAINEVRELTVSTKTAHFNVCDLTGQLVAFEVLSQEQENAATLRRNPAEMTDDYYYVTKIALQTKIGATDWCGYQLQPTSTATMPVLKTTDTIDNRFYAISATDGQLELLVKATNQRYDNFLTLEDGGDEGDTYDFSPAFTDWLLTLDFTQADHSHFEQGQLISRLRLNGTWQLPANLAERQQQLRSGQVAYQLELVLKQDSESIGFNLTLDNQVLDHRMRLVLHTGIQATDSFADTPFGTIQRPVEDPHLKDWQAIGYHEEPTSMRPMIHFANTHNQEISWSFLTNGMKDFQLIGDQFDQLAITLFRGVGYLGRPDLKRRPSDASGLQTKVVATPDSQLTGQLTFGGALVVTPDFQPTALQQAHLLLSQSDLAYQNQTINRFTTPLQYFMMNPTATAIKHAPILAVNDLQVTFSSFMQTIDGTGFELRLYNPTDQAITLPGSLELHQNCRIAELDLRGQVQATLATSPSDYDLTTFGPGEIRTYGIYPIQPRA